MINNKESALRKVIEKEIIIGFEGDFG